MMLTTPTSYPSRDIDTPLEYILYRLTSPTNSHIFIELNLLTSNGNDSFLSVGHGHDPVQAQYSNGILLNMASNWQDDEPYSLATPDNEAYILLGMAQEENIEFDITLSAFQCTSSDALPCQSSNQCYLPSEICDDVTQCPAGEDEYGCPNPEPPYCFNCSTPWKNNTCLPPSWVCDGTQDCLDNSDEIYCATPDPCFQCQNGSDYDCVSLDWICDGEDDCYDGEDELNCNYTSCFECQNGTDYRCVSLDWICDGEDDCYDGEDELNCNDTSECTNGTFSCPEPDSTCINETLRCNFKPDCANTAADETEELCMVSQISEDVSVTFRYRWLMTPDSYPSRDIETPHDYLLYRLTSPADSHMLIEIVKVTFTGSQSALSIGSGLDPVQAYYFGVLETFSYGAGWREVEPLRLTTPSYEAYILLERYPGEIIEMTIRLSAFQCTREGDIPCAQSSDCYLVSEICDGTVQCEYSQEDESACNTPTPDSQCFPCNSSECVDFDYVCDGWYDCYDILDELGCNDTDSSCFPCYSEWGCVQDYWVCDGQIHCLNGLDEQNCNATSTPSPTEPPCFDCDSIYDCVDNPAWVCDGTEDCYSGEDELNCTFCGPNEVACLYDVSICINVSSVCDGESDCPLGTDEFGCTATSTPSPTEPPCFECDSVYDCVYDPLWVCDGFADCNLGEDELNCPSFCGPNEVACLYDDTVCINVSSVCDGESDCPLGTDEFGCTGCGPDQYACYYDNTTCIYAMDICDGYEDCPSGSDEFNCSATIPPSTPDPTCFACNSIYDCVYQSWVCDGYEDCYDGEDELNCPFCGPDQFACYYDNTTCIDASDVCNGYYDCIDGSDEFNCTVCGDNQYSCYFDPFTCLNTTDICDGIYDCPGGGDEYNCTGCFACPGSSVCLTDLQVCNFYNDCIGGEDEAESLCNHSQYINEVPVTVGEWLDFAHGYVRERHLGRHTPASYFYDFEHYVFNSTPGTTLYLEIQDLSVNLTGPLLSLVRVSAGSGMDPTDLEATQGYIDGYGDVYSVSYTTNFSLASDVGFLLLAVPHAVYGSFYIQFRVTAVACESTEMPCVGSPHCYDWYNDTCDGEIQCLDSKEDEFGCEECFQGYTCAFDDTCFQPRDVCDGIYDCPAGVDEFNCTGCFACPGSDFCLVDVQVCDFFDDCPNGEDEAESLCKHSEFIAEIDVPTGEWITITQSSGDAVEDCGTLASRFYDFYHYVFNSSPGTTLFVELQNTTWDWTSSPLYPLVRVFAGPGEDATYATYDEPNTGYLDGFGFSYSISDNYSFSLTNNTGYVVITFPKGVDAYVEFRVISIECESPEELCYGSPHCWNPLTDYCDGVVQCLNSQEDEFECPSDCSFNCTNVWSNDTCLPESWICDAYEDCVDGSDEAFCPTTDPSECFPCYAPGWDCLPYDYVCDGLPDCLDATDESNCNTTTTPTNGTCPDDAFDCVSDYCVLKEWICDGILDCYDGLDEADCGVCEDDEWQCYYDQTCVQANETCDGYYDCPGGVDEYNCTGCFACPGSSDCLYELQICDFYNHCPGGEDEAESLCRHSEFIKEVQVPTGEWVTIEQSSGSEDNRSTPASDFVEFTHYVFRGESGTTLFMELLNYTWSYGPLLPLLRIYAGNGDDPTDLSAESSYLDGSGYSESISYSDNFTLNSDVGFALVGFPKGIDAYVKMRVTAIACESPETSCIGSPNCVYWVNDTCDGVDQCVYSKEDELNCDGDCDLSCYFDNSTCLYFHDYCDGEYDCRAGEDEYDCPGCFTCPGSYDCIVDSVVCDFYNTCPGGEDEVESLCRDSEFIIDVNVTTGEWVSIEQRSGDPVEDRGTGASKFYDFYHYVFSSPPGTTLFMELQNYTWSSNADPVLPLLRIIAGSGDDPASGPGNRAYWDASGFAYSISFSQNFSLTDNTGFVLLAFPKDVEAYVVFRVTAVACEDNDTLCYGSPHCLDWTSDTCDGEVQCLYSEEDEYQCPTPCFDCVPLFNTSCVPLTFVCDDIPDCVNGTDEIDCCGTCYVNDVCLSESQVCDLTIDCPDQEDESEELCQYSYQAEYYDVSSEQTLTLYQPAVYPFNNPSLELALWLFTAPSGSSLFFDLQQFQSQDGYLHQMRAGSGHDPSLPDTVDFFLFPYFDSSSQMSSFTIEDDKAYAVIGRHLGYRLNITLAVTAVEPCEETEFRCSVDGSCLSESFRCDNVQDCSDYSDELPCTCEADEFKCEYGGECIASHDVCNLNQECFLAEDESNCGYEDISTDVSLTNATDEYQVNSIVPVPVGDNLIASLWRFYAPDSSYFLSFKVSAAYTLPAEGVARFGPGTDFLGDSVVATYYTWGSITPGPSGSHEFYVFSHEAFLSVTVPDESSSVSLSFLVTPVQGPDCPADSTVCVRCEPNIEPCMQILDCSQDDGYMCP